MDAWETLKDGSTLGDGFDAWEYLDSQGGGLGTVIVEGVMVEIDMSCYDVEIETNEFYAEVEPAPEFDVEIESDEFEVEICYG